MPLFDLFLPVWYIGYTLNTVIFHGIQCITYLCMHALTTSWKQHFETFHGTTKLLIKHIIWLKILHYMGFSMTKSLK